MGQIAAAPGQPGSGAPRVVYGVWEQEANQALTPLLADILDELVDHYGDPIVVEAVREAIRIVRPKKLRLKHVIRVLERWERNGQTRSEMGSSRHYDPVEFRACRRAQNT